MKRVFACLLLSGCAAAPPPVAPAPDDARPSAAPPSVAVPAAVATPPGEFRSDPVPQGKFLFYDDFEHGFDKWTLPDAGSGVGFRPLMAKTCGGWWSVNLGMPDHVFYTPAAGEHLLALKAPLDLAGAKKPYFKYDVKGQTAPVETVWMQAELQGPDGAWKPVGRVVKGGYVNVATIGADVTAFAGAPAMLRFRVVYQAGATGTTRGMYLDDVQVIEPSS